MVKMPLSVQVRHSIAPSASILFHLLQSSHSDGTRRCFILLPVIPSALFIRMKGTLFRSNLGKAPINLRPVGRLLLLMLMLVLLTLLMLLVFPSAVVAVVSCGWRAELCDDFNELILPHSDLLTAVSLSQRDCVVGQCVEVDGDREWNAHFIAARVSLPNGRSAAVHLAGDVMASEAAQDAAGDGDEGGLSRERKNRNADGGEMWRKSQHSAENLCVGICRVVTASNVSTGAAAIATQLLLCLAVCVLRVWSDIE